MAKSLNRVTILGNLGQDPELRSTATGKSVCNLNVATTESYKDNSGDWKDVTDWHRVVMWDRLADIAAQYLKKGDKVYLEGKIKTRSYEQDGITKYITEIVANNMIMMGGGGGKQQSSDNYNSPKTQSSQDNMSNYESNNDNATEEFDDEDVPF